MIGRTFVRVEYDNENGKTCSGDLLGEIAHRHG